MIFKLRIFASLLLITSIVNAQNPSIVYSKCACDCEGLPVTSNDILLKVTVTSEIGKSIRIEDIMFEISGERFEGKRYHNGEYQILIPSLSIKSDSIFFGNRYLGFEQNETNFELESDYIYRVSLDSRILSNRVFGGELVVERMINIIDTKSVTIYSEEIGEILR